MRRALRPAGGGAVGENLGGQAGEMLDDEISDIRPGQAAEAAAKRRHGDRMDVVGAQQLSEDGEAAADPYEL